METILWINNTVNPFIADKNIFENVSENYDIRWVRDFYEFNSYIYRHYVPDIIFIDYNLNEEHLIPKYFSNNIEEAIKFHDFQSKSFKNKTGLDCIKWLIARCKELETGVPKIILNTENIVGKIKINTLIGNIEYINNQPKKGEDIYSFLKDEIILPKIETKILEESQIIESFKNGEYDLIAFQRIKNILEKYYKIALEKDYKEALRLKELMSELSYIFFKEEHREIKLPKI